MRRIFISSVMRGFGPERQAAQSAVTLLRQQPVMAEDFGAKSHSPQAACLEGVRSSEIYIGVFGCRYGYVAPTSGLAVTEEEFNEAHRLGIQMLCFVSTGDKEPAQTEFLSRVMSYEGGLTIAHYDEPTDLRDKVVQSLHFLFGEPGVGVIDAAAATAHLDQHEWGAFRSRQGEASIGIVIFPERQWEKFFSLQQLESTDTKDMLLCDATFGSPALLPRRKGVDTDDGQDCVVFSQPTQMHNVSSRRLSVHTDGTIKYGVRLGGDDRMGGFSLVRSLVIDRNEVQTQIEAFLRFSSRVYDRTEQSGLVSSLFLGLSLCGVAQKAFGEIPDQEPVGISIPMHALEDPLRIPQKVLRVPRAKLVEATSVSGELVEQIQRTFRSAGAEYNANAIRPR